MRRVILNMKDYIFADAVATTLREDKQGEFYVLPTTTPEEALQYGTSCEPYALLLEVNSYPPYVLEERLKIRDAVKKVNPDCKIVLVVDENSEKKVAEEVRRAKKAGRIDQFIYGSISASYLVALMDTLYNPNDSPFSNRKSHRTLSDGEEEKSMAEKPEIGKKEKLKKEAAVSSVEIKQKDRLNGTAAFDPNHGCGNEPPKIKLPPRVDDPPKCGNEPPVIPPVKATIKKGKK